MKSGLIVNPQSGKQSGKGLALAAKVKDHPDVMVRVLEDFGRLSADLRDLAEAGATNLFVSSGDGTIQAIQTVLAERRPFKVLPRLALLPHGTTNMTAADLGFRDRNLERQAAFVKNPIPREECVRPTLRVANPADGKPRHGMFLGTGAVWNATLFCQRVVHDKGLKGEWATFATLAAAIGKSVFAKPDPGDETRIDRPYEITVTAGGTLRAHGTHLLLLATTLEKLILGTRPFWGGRAGPVRTTLIPYPVPGLARWLLPVMYGGESRGGPPGSLSFSGSGFEVETRVPFVIDGEFFDPPKGEPLRIETGPDFTYIRG